MNQKDNAPANTRRMGLRAKFRPSCDTAHAKFKRSNTFSRPACRVFGCYGLGLKNQSNNEKDI